VNTTPVLLFNPFADASHAARLHSTACPMADTSGRRILRIEGAEIERMIPKLKREGFAIRECTCLGKTQLNLLPTD